MAADFEPRRVSLPVRIAGFCALAVVGGVSGYLFARFTDFNRDTVNWDDALAYLIGFVLIALGAMIGLTLVTKPGVIPRGTGGVQILVLVLGGIIFLAPMMATAWASPAVVFAAMVALFVVQTIGNAIAWRQADEMLRRVMAETSVIAFWGLQCAFFFYAAAERLGLIAPVSPWGLAGVLMAVYLVSSIVPSMRRGIA